ncbi:uncharacterized protein BJ212DRAFT_1296395 [Suillus subaureus]|uniref:Uncharacterized protein n=1 Tax=Suillus subaureus TaxID=48587 RepID=A0A9P7JI35_9AGAM|nr:uncharacterized protein BJ212DRAFT_1296395 [Suillus subaureus]KAG1823873.1 hypothetical protein BJ212DRAFT_1296395 [Suillus subaureus]
MPTTHHNFVSSKLYYIFCSVLPMSDVHWSLRTWQNHLKEAGEDEKAAIQMKILKTLLLEATLLLEIPLLNMSLLLKISPLLDMPLHLEIPPLLDMPLHLKIPPLLNMSLCLEIPPLLNMPLHLLTIQISPPSNLKNGKILLPTLIWRNLLIMLTSLIYVVTWNDRIGLTGDALEHLQNPPRCQPEFGSADVKYGVTLFLALEHSSEDAFHKTCAATLAQHPEDEIPSLHQVKNIITDLSGVTSIVKDMCIDSCVAFVGPYTELDECPMCQKPRYDPIKLWQSGGQVKHLQQVFHTFPIGPQLQALWQHPDSAHQMHYRWHHTQEIIEQLECNDGLPTAYDDIITGSSYLDTVR